jgi:hypothetical protein
MRDVVGRLYRTRLVLSCFILVGTGIALLTVENLLADSTTWSWLTNLPLHEIGATLIGGGIFGVWLDYFMRREAEAVDEQRLRSLLHDQAPVMRDAVLQAFAANHEDLKRVATPEMLDQVITNSLALRLDDQQFASEVYTDIRDQAVGALERWYDAMLSIELSEPEVSHLGPKAGTKFREEYLAVTVRWEYTVVPKHPVRRFVCLSDRDEYLELANERGATSAWYQTPGSGLDASSPEAFQLVRFSVDGEERTIRRTSRKDGQAYAASIGREALDAGKPVTIAYTYQLTMRRDGNYLFFDIEQPTRDLRVDFDYGGAELDAVSVLDLIPSVRRTVIERPIEVTGSRVLRVDIQGWVFPRSGVAFVWSET